MACGMADWLNVGGLLQMLQDAATKPRNLGKVGKRSFQTLQSADLSLDLKKKHGFQQNYTQMNIIDT